MKPTQYRKSLGFENCGDPQSGLNLNDRDESDMAAILPRKDHSNPDRNNGRKKPQNLKIHGINEARLYWKEQEANLPSMFRKINADSLDAMELKEMTGYFPDLKGKRILELASGIGRYTRFFSERAHHLTTVDLVEQFVKKNRETHADCRNVEWICSDAMQLQLKEKSLDFIFSNWLFMYLEDREVRQLIDQLHRALSPNGELFFRESCDLLRSMSQKPGYFAHYRTIGEYTDLLEKKWKILKEGEMKTYIYCFCDPFQCFWHARKH